MRIVTFFIAVSNIASVYLLKAIPYEIRKLSRETICMGPEPRIYHGTEAFEGQFPYMIFVLMYQNTGISHCSASLLSPDWVLLAAHCVNFDGLVPKNIISVGGKASLSDYIKERLVIDPDASINETRFGLQERRAKAFYIHPGYNTENLWHDVALIQLNEPFDSTDIKTISLSEDKMKQPKFCTILGWGLAAGNCQTYKLNFVEDKGVSTTEIGCRYKFSGSFICLAPDKRGICKGDSGSPLICDGKVWGVASHLIFYDSQSTDCGNSLEEYYSELHADLNWIKSVYKKENSINSMAVISSKGSLACFFAILWLFAKI